VKGFLKMAKTTKRRFAQDTSVPVNRSKGHIEELVRKYGAVDILMGEINGKIGVLFKMAERNIRFTVPVPDDDQERRSIYRALLLTIKAKLESAERGIETFDQAFLSQIVMPNTEMTVAETISESLEQIHSGKDVPLLPGY